MRAFLLTILTMALMTAGCTDSPDDAAKKEADQDGAATGKGALDPNITEEPEPVSIYSFQGEVQGASPTKPDGAGATDTPAKEEKFSLTEENQTLDFSEGGYLGAGTAHVDVVGPGGDVVWQGDNYYCAGAPGVVCAGLIGYVATTGTVEEAAAGDYTVRYWVAGAFEIDVQVSATPAAAGE